MRIWNSYEHRISPANRTGKERSSELTVFFLSGESGLAWYTSAMPSYTIVSRPDDVSEALKHRTEEVLKRNGYERNDAEPKTVFVIGGDGTFLYAVHQYLDHLDSVRFFGIHTGTFGFYSDYRDTDFDAFMEVFLKQEVTEYCYPILEGSTDTGETYYGVNEIRIENAARTQAMDVYINGRLLEQYRGTGMCVATQLGSTAYNRSLGGAVIQEGLNVIEMTEMSGIHHNKYRSLKSPLILSDQCEILFVTKSFAGALLGADSDVYALDQVKKLKISISKSKQVTMLKGRKVDYFDRLQNLF